MRDDRDAERQAFRRDGSRRIRRGFKD